MGLGGTPPPFLRSQPSRVEAPEDPWLREREVSLLGGKPEHGGPCQAQKLVSLGRNQNHAQP